MNCPHCASPHPDSANFCSNCGTALSVGCTGCGAALPAKAKFCLQCGRPVSRPSAETAAARLRQYIPEEIAAKLESTSAGRAATETENISQGLEGERRVVTVLFCDVKGSTALAEQLDPEEWTEIMNAAFERLIEPVARFGGTVARLMGDAILAFFGAPIAHEDDPQRAVLAGLAIVEGIQEYRDQVKRERGLSFDVRVGINTGLVVVGEVGSSQRVEYTAMGDPVNLAARMEQSAHPGTVQISSHTYRLVAPLFECAPLGPLEVKGKSELVPAYRVVAARAEPGRLRGIDGRDALLVGRETELAILREVVAEQRQGRGRVVCLIGEAGLGKSRLIRETRALWNAANEDARARLWSTSRGVSYETLRPYGQFHQHLGAILDLAASDPPAAVRDKTARAVESAPAERQPRLRRALETLLVLPSSEDGPMLEGEALKRELFEAFAVILRGRATAGPTVLVFDDVHWADQASVDLLCHLFPLALDVPIVFLCAFRPDHRAPSGGVQAWAEAVAASYVEIALAPLTSADSTALLEEVLGAADIPPALRELAIQKAEGNPFFVEELVRALIDRGILERDPANGRLRVARDVDDIAVPDTIQGLLLTRIDRLPEDARHLLQVAAVIGRSFSFRLLRSIVGERTQIEQQLTNLIQLDLVRANGGNGDRELAFRHALTRDAAYGSILRKRRRTLHRRVGDALEQTYASHLDDHAALLAHHFWEASDDRAGPYEVLAGDVAHRLYANAEAIAHYGRAIELTRGGPSGLAELARRTQRDQSALALHLYLRRGRALELTGQYAAALANYHELEAVAATRGDCRGKLEALVARAIVRATPNPAFDPTEGQALLDQSLALARELDDRESECRILWNLLLLNTYTFEPARAAAYGEDALGIARALGLREQVAFTANDLQRAYLFAGQADRARLVLDEARALWRELGNVPMLIDNLSSKAHLDYLAGQYAQAIDAFEEADRLSVSIGNQWGRSFCRLIVGQIFLDRGEPDRAIEIMEDAIRFGEESGYPVALIGTRAHLAWAYGVLGSVERGKELARRGIRKAEETFRILRPWPLAALARLHVLTGDHAEAEAVIKECYQELRRDGSLLTPIWVMLADAELALARGDPERALAATGDLLTYLRDYQTWPFTAEALHLQARARLAQGQLVSARELLRAARAQAEALGATAVLRPILTTLSQVEERLGDLNGG